MRNFFYSLKAQCLAGNHRYFFWQPGVKGCLNALELIFNVNFPFNQTASFFNISDYHQTLIYHLILLKLFNGHILNWLINERFFSKGIL